MKPLSSVVIALLIMALTSCVRVSTAYTPAKSEYADGVAPSVDEAVLAYEGDVATLLEAGGVVIGDMQGAGNGFANHGSVERKVRARAAALGATHVVFVAAHDEEERTPISYNTSCKGNNCVTTTSGGYTFYRPRAGYLLIRVPSSSWNKLPDALGGPALTAAEPPRKRTGLAGFLGLRGSRSRAESRSTAEPEAKWQDRGSSTVNESASTGTGTTATRRRCYQQAITPTDASGLHAHQSSAGTIATDDHRDDAQRARDDVAREAAASMTRRGAAVLRKGGVR
jgi:hypothetical protein